MTIKHDMPGLMVYASMAVYLLAFLALLTKSLPQRFRAVRWGAYPYVFVTRLAKVGWVLFALGFLLSAGAMAWRGVSVSHIPLQSMFEIMLFIATVMFPLSVFCRLVLRVGGEAVDALLAAAVLLPVGFVFEAGADQLPPALQSPLFGPHVAVYLLAYAVMAKAAGQAYLVLRLRRDKSAEAKLIARQGETVERMVRLGFPLLTAGLILGSIWGKRAWGDYWNWDPKEMWSLATWLVFAGYFHVKASPGTTGPRAKAIIVLAGFALIVITLLWVNMSRLFIGLHNYAT